ncbi:nucleotide-binding domain containing protein [Halocatena marina]|uniref:Nucleotide-binding domain containing protein n=1 Tax=Halocatena marina TaxID=2934937 RepID=A0ABD5YUD2_9EURY
MTDIQISAAADHGFRKVRLETERLVDPDERDAERERVVADAGQSLDHGESVVIYTARGPDDQRIERTTAIAEEMCVQPGDVGRRIGTVQGEILSKLVVDHDLSRVCIAGGDTCGHATPMLGITAVRTRYPLAPGSPVCDALNCDLVDDNLQVALKGGQLGGSDYFVKILEGSKYCDDQSS